MARDFSPNANRSLRVVDDGMRRPLVSTGLGFDRIKQAAKVAAGFELSLERRLARGETLQTILDDPAISDRYKRLTRFKLCSAD